MAPEGFCIIKLTWVSISLISNLQAKTKSTAQRKEIFKRAEQYVKEYRQEVRTLKNSAAKETFEECNCVMEMNSGLGTSDPYT